MSVKVRRGLGLLVAAAVVWLVAFGLLQADTTPLAVLAVVFGAAAFAGAVAGVALLIWGLLRD